MFALRSTLFLQLCFGIFVPIVHTYDVTIKFFVDIACSSNGYTPLALSGLTGCIATSKSQTAWQILSIKPTFLNDGCTVTAYTDPYCSDNATAARLDQCVYLTESIQSITIDGDGCLFSTSGATTNTTTSPNGTASGSPRYTSDGDGLDHPANLATIIGAAVGGFVGIVGLIITIVKCCCCRR